MTRKPLIIGMGPAQPYPGDAWHPLSPSTANLSYLIVGDFLGWPTVEDHFDAINLNRFWHRPDAQDRDDILASHARETLKAHAQAGGLMDRPVFLLGEKVTNFVFSFLRDSASPLGGDAWRHLPKCAGHRLCIDDREARRDERTGYYDCVAMPVWHPRNVTAPGFRMPHRWQQRMSDALRSAAGLPSLPFVAPPGKASLRITDINRAHRRRYFDRYQMELTQHDLAALEHHLFPSRWTSAIVPLRRAGLI